MAYANKDKKAGLPTCVGGGVEEGEGGGGKEIVRVGAGEEGLEVRGWEGRGKEAGVGRGNEGWAE